ncbi:MAG: TspO/MBR family protein [Bacteroidales bacterium]|nr:TspO/MBR family protein [Bacteroidales bacterium]
MNYYYKLVIFLLINFGALWLGSFLQGEGARSSWYQSLELAPWTPPGWAFGVAWVSIMICFSFFMAYAADLRSLSFVLLLFILQFILNVSWNAIFFRYHFVGAGLVVILLLTIITGFFVFWGIKHLQWKTLLVLPYFIWLLLAISLNWYTWIRN